MEIGLRLKLLLSRIPLWLLIQVSLFLEMQSDYEHNQYVHLMYCVLQGYVVFSSTSRIVQGLMDMSTMLTLDGTLSHVLLLRKCHQVSV